MTIAKLDAVAAVATADKTISLDEAKKLVREARAVVAHSGNPTASTTAVLKRFDRWAKNKYVGDARVVKSLDKVVRELTNDAKTFTALGIRTNRWTSKGSARVSGGEAGGSRRVSGGESNSSRRISGGESNSSRRISGGESNSSRRVSGGESNSSRRVSGGESDGWRGGRVSGGER